MDRANVYRAYESAVRFISAYAIMEKDGTYLAKAVFKRSRAGYVTCYLQVFGFPMVKAVAKGQGYDKLSAAFDKAVTKAYHEYQYHDCSKPHVRALVSDMVEVVRAMGGKSWDSAMTDKGFRIIGVV